MISSLYALAAVALVIVVLRARTYVVLCVFATATFLIPAPLLVPYTGSSFLSFHHVLTLAGLARLAFGLIDRSTTRRQLVPAGAQVSLLVLTLVAFFGGIAFAADAGPLGAAGPRFADLVDQLVWFTVVLVLARQVGARAMLSAAAVGLTAGLGVAAFEHFTSFSWGQALFAPFPLGKAGLAAANPLASRDGTLRVRAGAEFALQFGWLVVAFAPALLVTALRKAGVWLACLAAVACMLVVYWSYSRTALAALVVVVVLTAMFSANRGFVLIGVGLATASGLAYASLGVVQAHLSEASGGGSIAVRGQRLGPAMEVASSHPFRGAGLGRLITAGFPTTDQAFLLEYVELGVIGAVALVLVFVAAVGLCARAVWLSSAQERVLAVASLLGAVSVLASCFAYDTATLLQGMHSLWFMVAAAAALVPIANPLQGSLSRLPRIALAGTAGLLIGVMVYVLAPQHTAQSEVFSTLPIETESAATYDPLPIGTQLVNTVCLTVRASVGKGVKVDCTDTFGAAGTGKWRIQAATPFELEQTMSQLTQTVRQQAGVRYLELLPLDAPRTGRDTWARTAPVWSALVAAGLTALLWPRRRRRSAGGDHPDEELACNARRIGMPVGVGS